MCVAEKFIKVCCDLVWLVNITVIYIFGTELYEAFEGSKLRNIVFHILRGFLEFLNSFLKIYIFRELFQFS